MDSVNADRLSRSVKSMDYLENPYRFLRIRESVTAESGLTAKNMIASNSELLPENLNAEIM